jgi:hypothetical protein
VEKFGEKLGTGSRKGSGLSAAPIQITGHKKCDLE